MLSFPFYLFLDTRLFKAAKKLLSQGLFSFVTFEFEIFLCLLNRFLNLSVHASDSVCVHSFMRKIHLRSVELLFHQLGISLFENVLIKFCLFSQYPTGPGWHISVAWDPVGEPPF